MSHRPATVIYVRDDGTAIEKEVKRISPDRLKTSCPAGSKFVVRMGPKTKQWEVYDLRKYISNPTLGQFYAAPPPSILTPDRDRALFWAALM